MKVLLVCADDWAGLMHGHAQALRSIGVDAEDCKLKPHVFQYDSESPVIKAGEMIAKIRTADIVMIYHSSRSIVNLIKQAGVKSKFVVVHTGSDYRSNPDEIRALFKSIGVVHELTDQCEFLMIDPALSYVTAAMDVDAIRRTVNPLGYVPERGSKLVLAHFPSKSDVKGSDSILSMIEPYKEKFHFHYSDERVSHQKNLFRMFNCDVYVELFQPELNGKPYGCYGVTAFEAAAMGKVVITQNIYQQAYRDAYGVDSPFVIANDAKEFSTILSGLSTWGNLTLERHQNETLAWVRKHHSLQATGERIKKVLERL